MNRAIELFKKASELHFTEKKPEEAFLLCRYILKTYPDFEQRIVVNQMVHLLGNEELDFTKIHPEEFEEEYRTIFEEALEEAGVRTGKTEMEKTEAEKVPPVSGAKKVRITVMRKACYRDLMEQYENPIEHACAIEEGMVFVANGWKKPAGLCDSAWETLSPFVMALSHGAEDLYDGWMKNKKSAMLSCNDGFRPVSFLLETIDDEERS